jgi:ElaB/YqjD/DUF883 family membrane-anchored ribosome-binding protein
MHGKANTIEETTNGVRQQAAESLERAAESVRSAGDQGAAALSDLTNGAGEKLDSGANLIRNFDGDDLVTELRRAIKRNPVASLALGTAIGLIAGFAFFRRVGSED